MARFLTLNHLPTELGIFPLSGALLLPRGQLPLNVFEPRYLALVEAALSGSRMIGMIQPTENEEKTLKPALSAIGCAGRITGYRETDDNRYLITLSGICRFRVADRRSKGVDAVPASVRGGLCAVRGRSWRRDATTRISRASGCWRRSTNICSGAS